MSFEHDTINNIINYVTNTTSVPYDENDIKLSTVPSEITDNY